MNSYDRYVYVLDVIWIQSQYACCDAQYACCTIFFGKMDISTKPF